MHPDAMTTYHVLNRVERWAYDMRKEPDCKDNELIVMSNQVPHTGTLYVGYYRNAGEFYPLFGFDPEEGKTKAFYALVEVANRRDAITVITQLTRSLNNEGFNTTNIQQMLDQVKFQPEYT